MGVKNLNVIVGRCLENRDIASLNGKIVIVDANNMLYRFMIGQRSEGSDIKDKTGRVVGHLSSMFKFVVGMRRRGIMPIFVFDGRPGSLKDSIIEERKTKRLVAIERGIGANTTDERIKWFKRSFRLEQSYIEECIALFNALGIEVIHGDGEADAVCAALLRKYNNIYGVVSDDSDLLLYGCQRVLKNFSLRTNDMTCMNLDDIMCRLRVLTDDIRSHNGIPIDIEFGRTQFIELCALLGTDYNKRNRIRGCSPLEIIDLYTKTNFDLIKMVQLMDVFNREVALKYIMPPDLIEQIHIIIGEYSDHHYIPLDIELPRKSIDRSQVHGLLNSVFSTTYIDKGIQIIRG